MEPGYLTTCEARAQKTLALERGRIEARHKIEQAKLKERGAKFCASCNTYYDDWEEDDLTKIDTGDYLCPACYYFYELERMEKEE